MSRIRYGNYGVSSSCSGWLVGWLVGGLMDRQTVVGMRDGITIGEKGR